MEIVTWKTLTQMQYKNQGCPAQELQLDVSINQDFSPSSQYQSPSSPDPVSPVIVSSLGTATISRRTNF